MIKIIEVRRVFLLGLAGVAAAAGCKATNLIGEVREQEDGGSSMIADAGPGEFLVIGDPGGEAGRTGSLVDAGATGSGGNPGPSIDASEGIDAVIILGTGGSHGSPADAALPPPIDASVVIDALGGGCPITYPATGFFGRNVAYAPTTFTSQTLGIYTLAADVPLGVSLSFTMTRLSGSGGEPSLGALWYLGDNDFRFTTYDPPTQSQRFMSRLPGRNEVSISFMGAGAARIDFYECGSPVPTRVEVIDWAP